MEITVRVEVQYNAPENAVIRDMLRMFRTPVWVRFMVRYISPHLKNCAPVNKEVMESLASWRTTCSAAQSCVICMNDMSEAVKLPCGHAFHETCIQSWLKMRSTCPTCRHQLPKAFSGCYAVRTLNSALVLREEHRHSTKDAILNSRVGQDPVRAVVSVTLGQVAEENRHQQFPCVLNAQMLHSTGEAYSEPDPVEKTALPSEASASRAPRTTGRRRRCDSATVESPGVPASASASKRMRVN
ncbi:hypothetical protein PINS_up004898 [Pythium insidiosum]|nr:hypothetical protein PINS_up004898 [Pythium insidiosum]